LARAVGKRFRGCRAKRLYVNSSGVGLSLVSTLGLLRSVGLSLKKKGRCQLLATSTFALILMSQYKYTATEQKIEEEFELFHSS